MSKRNQLMLTRNLGRETRYWKNRTTLDDVMLAYLAGRYLKYENTVKVLKDAKPSNVGLTPTELGKLLDFALDFRKIEKRTGKWPNPDIDWNRQQLALESHLKKEWTPYLP